MYHARHLLRRVGRDGRGYRWRYRQRRTGHARDARHARGGGVGHRQDAQELRGEGAWRFTDMAMSQNPGTLGPLK
jgi:hypothetical protein